MSYFIINRTLTAHGIGPDIPEGTGFLLLAESGGSTKFALYSLRKTPEVISASMYAVSDALDNLLHSVKAYPPALAIARDEIRKVSAEISREEFQALLIQRLRFHLDNQRSKPYFLARVRRTELGYKSEGEYCWIVGYHSQGTRRLVTWVSDDYFIYTDSISDFELEESFITERFGIGAQN